MKNITYQNWYWRYINKIYFAFFKLAKIPGALPPLLGTDEYEANLQGNSGGGVFGDVTPNSGGVNSGSSGTTPFGFMQGSTRNSSPRSQAGASSVMGPLMGNYDPNSSERFSRKVFVGGLPPDIDEGKYSKILGVFIVN